MGLLLLGAGACDQDPQDPEVNAVKPPWLWATIGHFEGGALDLAYLPGPGGTLDLWLSGGTDGVFRQRRSPLGEWEFVGLGFPELAGGHPLLGVNEVVSVGGAVLARVRSNVPEVVGVHRFEGGRWYPSAEGIDDLVSALGSTRPGTAFAITDRGGVHLSVDDGRTWNRVWDQGPLSFLVHTQGAGQLLVGGATDIYFPFLMRSADGGRTWDETSFRDEFSLGDAQRLSGVGVVDAAQPTLYLMIGDTLYRSPDWGQSLEPVLTTPLETGTVLVNPNQSDEIVVVSDRVYYSTDAGGTWRAFEPPRGGALGPVAADWGNRVIAVLERQAAPSPARLECFNLDAITPETGDPYP